MFTRRSSPRRLRGAHAAARESALPPPPATRQEPVTAAMHALRAAASGSPRAAASYLTALTPAELEAAGAAARDLAGLAAAVARTLQHDLQAPPPAGFTLCLACRVSDLAACGDPACASYPPSPAGAGPAAAASPASGDTVACD